jgi:hypothetical protein
MGIIQADVAYRREDVHALRDHSPQIQPLFRHAGNFKRAFSRDVVITARKSRLYALDGSLSLSLSLSLKRACGTPFERSEPLVRGRCGEHARENPGGIGVQRDSAETNKMNARSGNLLIVEAVQVYSECRRLNVHGLQLASRQSAKWTAAESSIVALFPGSGSRAPDPVDVPRLSAPSSARRIRFNAQTERSGILPSAV